jgi:hypothetical protein
MDAGDLVVHELGDPSSILPGEDWEQHTLQGGQQMLAYLQGPEAEGGLQRAARDKAFGSQLGPLPASGKHKALVQHLLVQDKRSACCCLPVACLLVQHRSLPRSACSLSMSAMWRMHACIPRTGRAPGQSVSRCCCHP